MITVPETIEELLNEVSPKIIPALKECDAIVSGSCAMYYTMRFNGIKPEFIFNDVDIFVAGMDQDGTHKSSIIFNNIFHEISHSKAALLTEDKYDYPTKKRRSYKDSLTRPIEQVRKLILDNGLYLEMIFLNSKFIMRSKDYVEKYFDLDFCKCWYDGKELRGPIDLLEEKKCFLSKIPMIEHLEFEPVRFVKYLLSVKNNSALSQLDDYDPLTILSRMRKYKERGFTIDTTKFEIPFEQIVSGFSFWLYNKAFCEADEISELLNIDMDKWIRFKTFVDTPQRLILDPDIKRFYKQRFDKFMREDVD